MAKNTEKLLLRGKFPDSSTPVDIVLQRGKVAAVRKAGRATPDLGSPEAWIAPPLFDIQVNGVNGISLQGAELWVADVAAISDYLAHWGVKYWVPTLVTGSLDEMEAGCRVLAAALRDRRLARSIPGIHLEGPCISPEDGPRGAHPRRHVRPPKLAEFDRLYKAADGKVLYTTVAPELPGAVPYIRGVVRRGVQVSLGHHAASAAQVKAAADAGARLCTHLGNGAAAQMHRHLNPIWPQLAEDRLHASLIADLHHLPPEVLQSFVRAKQPKRLVLTSDCVDLAGMPPGKYTFSGADVELRRDGKICLSGTDFLAGSSLMLLQGVVNTWRNTDLTLGQALASASSIPASLFGLRHRFELPKPGRKADFLLFEASESAPTPPKLLAVFHDGKAVEEKYA